MINKPIDPNSLNKAEIAPQFQGEIDFDRPARPGPSIIVKVRRGDLSLSGYYEGDLSVTGKVQNILFDRVPLDNAYGELLEAYFKESSQALRRENVKDVTSEILRLYDFYTKAGRELHQLAARSVCTDGSRMTTALTFANTYLFTVIHLGRLLLNDGITDPAKAIVQVDRSFGGMELFDGIGMKWGYDAAPRISRIQRTDPSRGKSYLASRDEDVSQKKDLRLSLLIGLLSEEAPTLDTTTPNTVFHPIADAFRASPESMTGVLIKAVAALRRTVLDADREQPEEEAI